MHKKAMVYLIGVILPVVLVFVLYPKTSAILQDVISNIFPRVSYYEFKAEITFDNRRYALTSTSKCIARGGKSGILGASYGLISKKINGGIISKKLPSSGGLIIVGPEWCPEKLKIGEALDVPLHQNKRSSRIASKDVRYFWLNNTDTPSIIEAYFPRYFQQSDTRFKINKLTYKRIAKTSKYRSDDKINWLEINRRNRCQNIMSENWKSFLIFLSDRTRLPEIPFEQVLYKLENGLRVMFRGSRLPDRSFYSVDYNNNNNFFCIDCIKAGKDFLRFRKFNSSASIQNIINTGNLPSSFTRSEKRKNLIINHETENLGFLTWQPLEVTTFCVR